MTRVKKRNNPLPVPRTSYYWWREYRGIWKAVDHFPELTDEFGGKWVRSMRAHYLGRLARMYDQRPTNVLKYTLRELPKV